MNHLYAEPDYTQPFADLPLTVLSEGDYKGFNYIIIDSYFAPCAYVEIPPNSILSGYDYRSPILEDINSAVHCGLTFSDTLEKFELDRPTKSVNLSNWFLGWDYGHACDRRKPCTAMESFLLSFPEIPNLSQDGTAYTTPEIILDCQKACKQLAKICNVPLESSLLYKKEQDCMRIVNNLKIKHPCLLKQIYDIGAIDIIMYNPDGEGIRIGCLSNHKYPVPIQLLGIECEITSFDVDSQNLTVLEAQCSSDDFVRLEEVFALENKI